MPITGAEETLEHSDGAVGSGVGDIVGADIGNAVGDTLAVDMG